MKKNLIILFFMMATIFLGLAGCKSNEMMQLNLPPALTVEEYLLVDTPISDPLTFIPANGTQNDILLKRQKDRGNLFPDNSIFQDGQPGISTMVGNERIVALESVTSRTTDQGVFQKVTIQILRDGELVDSFTAGDASPINSIQGLWAFSDHWVLEIANVTQDISPQSEISLDVQGQIIQDGDYLNDRYHYEEVFNFQLMRGKPFYFFKKDGLIGISYDNQEIQFGYSQIPHYQCCSAAALNPRRAQDMVAFFAQRDGKWYYVEIGAYE